MEIFLLFPLEPSVVSKPRTCGLVSTEVEIFLCMLLYLLSSNLTAWNNPTLRNNFSFVLVKVNVAVSLLRSRPAKRRLAGTKTRQRRTFQRALRRELGTSQQVGPQYQSELQLPDGADYRPGGQLSDNGPVWGLMGR